MAVVSINITRETDFGEFGAVGRYRQLDGIVTFAVDPKSSANQHIVDLPLARTNEEGLVEFTANLSLVTPLDPDLGNGRLLVEIPNRGNKLTAGSFHQVVAANPEDRDNAGDGFLCHRGFSFLSIGWQWDPQVEDAMMLQAPEALIDGEPITGDVMMKLQPDRDRPHLTMMQLGQTQPSYPVHDPDSDQHQLYLYTNESRQLIDRADWQFARVSKGNIEKSDRHIHMADGFTQGTHYELVYQTQGAPVVGTGLLAIRDIASCLRYHDAASPLTTGFSHVMSYGISQTGRVLRHFLYEGLNRDEQERIAYDGMLIHIAGGQRGDFNHRFAQPSVVNIPGPGQRFPFAAGTTEDPVSARQDSLFSKLDDDAIPKVIISNTSWEYWRGDASLVHINETEDLKEHPSTRIYHIAGTHHIGGILIDGKQLSELPTGLSTAMPLNIVNSAPVFRALFIALDQWVTKDEPPPDSRHPSLKDHTAVARKVVLNQFAEQTEVPIPDTNKLPQIESYRAYVSDVGPGLNEVAGIQLPDLACPLAYHSGWNPRSPAIGAPDEIAIFAGFSIFFPKAEILAHYPDEATYLKQAGACIDGLIQERFVLHQDRQWMMNIAGSRYRAAIADS
jgi:hypothetical protein